MPDFDTLKRWAATEPELLDALLHQQLEELIAQASPERQRRLRGLQFRIDCQRRLAKNPLDSCIRIVNMMHDAFYSMRSKINELNLEPVQDKGTERTGNNVVRLADYRAKK